MMEVVGTQSENEPNRSEVELEGGQNGPVNNSEELEFDMEEGIFSEGENHLQTDLKRRFQVHGMPVRAGKFMEDSKDCNMEVESTQNITLKVPITGPIKDIHLS